MKYSVEYATQAVRGLRKMDRSVQKILLAWIEKNLVDCDDPRSHGRALTANHKGIWRYRIGEYRVLAEIDDGRIVILLLHIGHRKEVYK